MPEKGVETHCGKVGHEVQIKFIIAASENVGGFNVVTGGGKCRYQNECGIESDKCEVINKAIKDEADYLTAQHEEKIRRRREEQEKWGF